METIKIDRIVVDKDQPRKLFAADKLARLKDSILKYGIMNPLKVEKLANGEYMLIDGERRYRAAKEAKLKEVPVIVTKPINQNDRLIRQFHLQQQNEDWTNVEKAMAVLKLAEETKMGIQEIGQALAMPSRTVQRYIEFGQIIDKDTFLRSELSLEWAQYINSVNTTARLATQRELKKSFTHSDSKNLEKAVISRILSGEIKRPNELAKMKDTFRTDPTTIQTFIESPRINALDLFNKSGAVGNFYLRSVMGAVRSINSNVKQLLDVKVAKIDKINTNEIKRAIGFLNKLNDLAE